MTTKENLPVTRKASLFKAISLLKRQKDREQEIERLKELATGFPFTQWTEKSVTDCIDDFYLENRRIPTVTDLVEKKANLPSHTTFTYLFGVSASSWLKQYEENFIPPKTSARRSLTLAVELLKGEEKQRIQELILEYPVTKWNTANTVDCIVSYYEKHGRVPTEKDMNGSSELPYDRMFQYRWKTTYHKWLEKNIPSLNKIFYEERISDRDYVSEFVEEYKRISPRTEAEFNLKRNREICSNSEYIKRVLKLHSWKELVTYCGQKPFDPEEEYYEKERAKIKAINLIDVDCGENIFFREYSKILEREVAKFWKE